MKKGLSIILLFLSGIATFGLYLGLKLLQVQAHEKATTLIRQKSAKPTLAVFTDIQQNAAVSWETPDKEFHYQGNMYDIAATKKLNGHIYYYCFADREEGFIFEMLAELAGGRPGNNGDMTTPATHLIKLFVQTFIPVEPMYVARQYCVAINPYIPTANDVAREQHTRTSISPPPKAHS